MNYINKFPLRRFAKYIITGGTALAIDFSIYYLLTRLGHTPYLLSRAISLAIAMIWNFSLNRNWTFQATKGKLSQQAVKFLVVMVSTSIFSLLLMRIGVSILHFNDLFVILAVTIITTLFNFSAHLLWSYK